MSTDKFKGGMDQSSKAFHSQFEDIMGKDDRGPEPTLNYKHENVGKKFMCKQRMYWIAVAHWDGPVYQCYSVHDEGKKLTLKHSEMFFKERG